MRNQSGEAYAASKYREYMVKEACTLTEFINKQMSGISRNKLKDILRGHGVTVDYKLVTRHDFQLVPGNVVRITRHRRNTELINPKVKPAPDNIKDKHFYRKHGENAYYGQ